MWGEPSMSITSSSSAKSGGLTRAVYQVVGSRRSPRPRPIWVFPSTVIT
jgi:hypothetical protein